MGLPSLCVDICCFLIRAAWTSNSSILRSWLRSSGLTVTLSTCTSSVTLVRPCAPASLRLSFRLTLYFALLFYSRHQPTHRPVRIQVCAHSNALAYLLLVSPGFAFVTYDNAESAARAVEGEHGTFFFGQTIRVQLREIRPRNTRVSLTRHLKEVAASWLTFSFPRNSTFSRRRRSTDCPISHKVNGEVLIRCPPTRLHPTWTLHPPSCKSCLSTLEPRPGSTRGTSVDHQPLRPAGIPLQRPATCVHLFHSEI